MKWTMNKELSEKIRIASLLCTFMVVMRHSRNLQAFWGTENVTGTCPFIENGFSIMTEIAVPYFFIVSGFFFFRTNFYEKRSYVIMLQKKGHSLLIPFLLWNILWGAVLYLIGFMDWNEPFINKVEHLLMSDYYGALWYVRTLMVLMALVPLYDWIFTIDNSWLYLFAGIGLYFCWWPVDCSLFSTEGVFFFFMGGVLQRYQSVVSIKVSWIMVLMMIAVWCGIAFLRPVWNIQVNKLITLLGICSFWLLLDYLGSYTKKILLTASAMTFFIYVNHFWIVKSIKVAWAQLCPRNDVVALLTYLLLPLLTFGILLIVGRLWYKFSPHTFGFCMGGRK